MQQLPTADEAPDAHRANHRSSWAAHNWGWVLAFGIAAVAFGVALLTSAFASLSALAWLAGLYLLFMGVVELFVPLRSGGRTSRLAGAAIAIVGGVVLLAWPGKTLTVLAFVAGIALVAWGITSTAAALRSRRDAESWLWAVVVGAGLAALGVLIMAWPAETVAVVGVLLGLVAIVWGGVTVLHAFDLRRTGLRWEEARRLERERIDREWEEQERPEAAERPGQPEQPQGTEHPSGTRAA